MADLRIARENIEPESPLFLLRQGLTIIDIVLISFSRADGALRAKVLKMGGLHVFPSKRVRFSECVPYNCPLLSEPSRFPVEVFEVGTVGTLGDG